MKFDKILLGIEEYTQSHLISGLRRVIDKFPDIDFTDCMSRNQLASKKWLVDKLAKSFPSNYENVFILCGWYGTLAAILKDNNKISFNNIRSVDLDPLCEEIADQFNYELYKDKWKFKAFTQDIMNLDYNNISLTSLKKEGIVAKIFEKPDLLINTSCEHIDDFDKWRNKLPKSLKVALQSNNFEFHAQHTNCVGSLDEFIEQCHLSTISYQGQLDFPDYERYMIIGEI